MSADVTSPLHVNQAKPKRLAITIAGAVSLGSYEAGVLYEVLEAIRQHNQDDRTTEVPENRIVVDVLTGASAGGMTAIILGQKLLYEGASFIGPYNNPLYNIWVKGIDLKGLQATQPNELALLSLLSSDLIESISDSTLLNRYAPPGPPPARVAHPAVERDGQLRVGIALTSLDGVDYGYRVEPQGLFEYREYADQMTRLIDPTDPACDSAAFWTPLRQGAVACGAFPIAFRAQDVMRSAKSEPDDYPPSTLSKWPSDPRQFTYCDGGVLQNQPLGMAKNLVDLQDEHLAQESRYYLFVSPHAKDNGPPSTFQASDSDYFHLIVRLADVVMGQAGFRDWITAEGINDRVRLMDERAKGLKDGILGGAVAVPPLQATATALLLLLFPPGATLEAPGAHQGETRAGAESRIGNQYQSEIQALSGIPGAAVAFRDSMLAFETAAGLGARDQMRIYGITATASQLAGAGVQAFLGFFDQSFRDHDYDVGRTHARDVLLDPVLAGAGELGPIYFNPALNPIRPINATLDGIELHQVPPDDLKRFKIGLQRRVGQMMTEWTKGNLLCLPFKWIVQALVGSVIDRLS